MGNNRVLTGKRKRWRTFNGKDGALRCTCCARWFKTELIQSTWMEARSDTEAEAELALFLPDVDRTAHTIGSDQRHTIGSGQRLI